jgi:phosphate transport system protein
VEIDQMEVDLEEDCLKLLALYQPVASDLRYIIAVLKINNDLERIADLAVNICERAEFLATQKNLPIPFDFTAMSEKTKSMVKRSLDALVNLDATLATEVRMCDDEVDDLHRDMYTKFEDEVRKNPQDIGILLHYLGVSRALERIADHATNIAEDVIYLSQGKIVRHQPGLHGV